MSFSWLKYSSNSMIIWPLNLTFDQPLLIFNPNLGVDLRDQLLSKLRLKFEHFDLFGILQLLDFYWYINCRIWISFGQSIWRFSPKYSFQDFSDLWFSIIHNKSNSYREIMNFISRNSIFSLVSEYIIFIIFWALFILWFSESQL